MKALQLMIFDILEHILSYAETPGELGKYLTEQIRELVGGRVVILLQCKREQGHRVISICPARWQYLSESTEIQELAVYSHNINKTEIWEPEEMPSHIGNILNSMGFGLSLAVPLKIGNDRTGILLILDFLDSYRTSEIMHVIASLSPIVALIMRNSILYETQEEIIEERTVELRKLVDSLHYRISMEELVSSISGNFINLEAGGINQGINESLKNAGEFLGVDRSYIYLFSDEVKTINYVYEWCEDGITGSSEKLINITLEPFSWSTDKLKNLEYINVLRISDLPPEAEAEKNLLQSLHIQSLLAFPLILNKSLFGMFGFSTVKKEKIWKNEDITLIKIISEIFVNVLNRKKSEEEKKKLEQQIRQTQKMEAIGTLAGGIAHDFNNILGIIQGYTELTVDDLSGQDMALENMQQVLKACSRAQDLVRQILSFCRQNEYEKKSLNLSLVIKEAIKLLRPSLPATIEIKQNIKGENSIIMADVTQMHQILMNLSTNAAHAMREKGGILGITLENIEIEQATAKQYELLSPGHYAKLSVSDTGHGMDRSVMERIFDPYFTTKKSGEGTGMGLSVVHGIVKSHDGEITVYSEPGKGTVFHIYLPLIDTYQKEEREDLLPLQRGKERILLIDDEKHLVDFSEKLLDRLGYKVTSVTDSTNGLEIFLRTPDSFDIIITDQTMPVMTGVELAEKIMTVRPEIPVIICTGFSESIDSEKAAAMGIKQLLMKPFTLKDISQAIRKALGQ